MSALLVKQQCAIQPRQFSRRAPCPTPRRAAVSVAAIKPDEKEISATTGFIAEDNSGKANIYPSLQKPVLTTQVAGAQGLGGTTGVFILFAVLLVVAVGTGVVARTPAPESIQQVAAALSGDSLSDIAARIQASL